MTEFCKDRNTTEYLLSRHLEYTNWEEALRDIEKETGWSGENNVYVYEEAISACSLRRIQLNCVRPSGDAWEGRLFEKSADVRWARGRDGKFQIWVTRSNGESSKNDGGLAVEVTRANRFYMIGEIEMTASPEILFSEGRYPNRMFSYPVPDEYKPVQHDRAYIKVKEYRPVEPDWNKLDDTSTIEEELDQSFLITHRFISLNAGRDADG